MDMSYETIRVFGEQTILYRKTRLDYMVRNTDKLESNPIYYVDT